MRTFWVFAIAALLGAGGSGCDRAKKENTAPQPAIGQETAQAGQQPVLRAGHPPTGGAVHGGGAGMGGGKTAGSVLTGTVLESMDAGGYTYIKLKTPEGESWAAVRQTKVKQGQKVSVVRAMLMRGFKSKTLNRTFESIYFGALGRPSPGGSPAAGGGAQPATVAAAHRNLGKNIPVALSKPLPRAPGADGLAISEIYARKAERKDKQVAVRGKVVKFNANILGKNWLHLQDGSGSAAGQNNDLTVTSKDAAKVGEVVLVHGTLRLNRDFGAGYLYPVILEDAQIKR